MAIDVPASSGLVPELDGTCPPNNGLRALRSAYGEQLFNGGREVNRLNPRGPFACNCWKSPNPPSSDPLPSVPVASLSVNFASATVPVLPPPVENELNGLSSTHALP